MSPVASSSSAPEATPSARSSSSYDDSDDDISCPLCLDEMDVSDLSFKPCPCGYQICRFCWHYLKETLGQPCPACRQPYDDESVQFTPMKPEEIKHLQNVRKQKEREKKDSQVNTRRHLANVRVKQKSQVHVQGLTSKTANDENLVALKSPEQYGQFGRISKIFLSRRPPAAAVAAAAASSASSASTSHYPVHLYISYQRPQDAAACIAAMNGSLSTEGTRLRVSWGTTKYCSTFLKGQRCLNDNCMGAHELGEEIETSSAMSSTREAISDLKSAFKESESRKSPHPGSQHALPPSASWAAKGSSSSTSSPSSTSTSLPISRPTRPPQSTHTTNSRFPKTASHPLPPRPAAAAHIRHTSSTHTSTKPRRASSSAGSTTDNNNNNGNISNPLPRSSSPLPSASAIGTSHSPQSDHASAPPSTTTLQHLPASSDVPLEPTSLVTSPPPGLAPPHSQLPSDSSTPVPNRRPSQPVPAAAASPFADFDLALGTFDDGASFSFSLDLNAKGKQRSFENNDLTSPAINDPQTPHSLDANGPPGLQLKSSDALSPTAAFDRFHSSDLSSGQPPSRYYAGPFNPFDSSLPNLSNNGNSSSSDSGFTSPTTPFLTTSDDSFSRKASRFEFARTNGTHQQPYPHQHLPQQQQQYSNSVQYSGLRRDERYGNGNPPPPIGDPRMSSPITPAMMSSNSHLSSLSDEQQPPSAADIPLGQARANPRNNNKANNGVGGLLDGSSPWSGINLDDSYSTNALPAELTRNLVLSPEILASLPPLPPPAPSSGIQQHQQHQPLPESSTSSASSSFNVVNNKDLPAGLYQQSLHSLPLPHPHPSQQQHQQRRSFVHDDHPYGNAMNLGHDTRQSYSHGSPFANDNAATFQDPAILNMRMSPPVAGNGSANSGYGGANHSMSMLGMGMPTSALQAGMPPPHHPNHPSHHGAAYQSLDSSSAALMADHRKASVGAPAVKSGTARDR